MTTNHISQSPVTEADWDSWYLAQKPRYQRKRCTIKKCPNIRASKQGLCSAHVYRQRKGLPLDGIKTRAGTTLSQRFWKQVDKTPHADGCWIWTGRIHKTPRNIVGYGMTGNKMAHVYSWELHHKRERPSNMTIDHMCFNTLCVNPAHLRLATVAENGNSRSPLAAMGVYRYRHQFLAIICDNGARINLGIFDTAAEACNIVYRKRLKLWQAVTHTYL